MQLRCAAAATSAVPGSSPNCGCMHYISACAATHACKPGRYNTALSNSSSTVNDDAAMPGCLRALAQGPAARGVLGVLGGQAAAGTGRTGEARQGAGHASGVLQEVELR
jgi:hypothetical protein